jgi:hypothetical protein
MPDKNRQRSRTGQDRPCRTAEALGHARRKPSRPPARPRSAEARASGHTRPAVQGKRTPPGPNQPGGSADIKILRRFARPLSVRQECKCSRVRAPWLKGYRNGGADFEGQGWGQASAATARAFLLRLFLPLAGVIGGTSSPRADLFSPNIITDNALQTTAFPFRRSRLWLSHTR